MKILITGGLGHIGSYFLENIYKIKNIKKIYIIDNLSTNRYCSLFNLKNSVFTGSCNPLFNQKKRNIKKVVRSIRNNNKIIGLYESYKFINYFFIMCYGIIFIFS